MWMTLSIFSVWICSPPKIVNKAAVRSVPIALWLSPNSYNVCKKSRNWLTVGWWGLSYRLYCRSPAIVALLCCMMTVCWPSIMLWAMMIWATSGDSLAVGRFLTKLLLPDWSDRRLGVVSLLLVAGAGVDVLVSTVFLSLVSPTKSDGNHGCVCQQVRRILCKFGQYSSNYTKWEKDIGIKV